jgi:hypothetical protein
MLDFIPVNKIVQLNFWIKNDVELMQINHLFCTPYGQSLPDMVRLTPKVEAVAEQELGLPT